MTIVPSGWRRPARGARLWIVGALVLAALLVSRTPVEARPGDGPGGNFGLGLVVGEPTGVTAQIGISGSAFRIARVGTALNVAVGLDLFDDNRGFYGQVDYILLIDRLVHSGSISMPFYFGLGGFVADRGNVNIGARVPFGLQIDFQRAPIHIFVELILALTLVEEADLGVGAAAGFRYFF